MTLGSFPDGIVRGQRAFRSGGNRSWAGEELAGLAWCEVAGNEWSL